MHRLLRPAAALSIALLYVLALGAVGVHAAAAPTPWSEIDVTLMVDENPPVLIVAGTLSASAKLPADAELVLPAGAQPQWLGEILGGDPTRDPSLATSMTTDGSWDSYPFTLTRSRTAQIEANAPNAVTAEGSNFKTSVVWPTPNDTSEVRLSVKLPKNAEIVKPAEGATLVTDDPTANYYTRTDTDVKAGTQLALAFTYSLQGDSADSGGNSGPSTLTILLVVLGVAVVVLVVVIARSRRGPAPESDEGDDDTDDDGEGPGQADAPQPDWSDDALSDADEAHGDEPDTVEDSVQQATSTGRRVSPKALVFAVVAGAMVLAGVAAAMNATAPKATAEGITKQFAQGEACTVASIPLELASDADAEAHAERVFSALESVPDIVYGTLQVKESRVEVGYCDSSASEEQIRAALVQAGIALDTDNATSGESFESSATE